MWAALRISASIFFCIFITCGCAIVARWAASLMAMSLISAAVGSVHGCGASGPRRFFAITHLPLDSNATLAHARSEDAWPLARLVPPRPAVEALALAPSRGPTHRDGS